ncbi:nuclear transport factor 2 family protein [Hydrogenophaga sp.]|uniref:YybH family protein n=1 Tax=Hydrogenophaga sp. TaxID=1904254 RepID=UPI002719FD6A|nr:nuclear transport factor 2 family protein [Hydrogenophaga sp.]MDO9434469.1 nuclear transport factor 2 family protein [Hydrogenophaga sp.]
MAFRVLRVVAVVSVALAGLCMAPARADAGVDEAALRATLEQWRQDFNARRVERICDLFAPELRADVQDLPEQTYSMVCERLRRAMALTGESITMEMHIHDVYVSGASAVVRLTWRSTTAGRDGRPQTEDEQGLDVFARQPDGSWKIHRYMAYPKQRQ